MVDTIESRRTIERQKDAKIQSAGFSYSTRSKKYAYTQPTADSQQPTLLSSSLAALINTKTNIYSPFITLRLKAPF